MDLSKAFDCLPHSLIIAKLHAYGLSLDACKFLSSYRLEVAGTKEWRFMTEVTGSSFQKVYHKDPFLDLYYSIFSWMTRFFLSSIAIYIIMLMTIPCLHRQNLSMKPWHCYKPIVKTLLVLVYIKWYESKSWKVPIYDRLSTMMWPMTSQNYMLMMLC